MEEHAHHAEELDVAVAPVSRMEALRRLTPRSQEPIVLVLTLLTVGLIVSLLLTEVHHRVQITQLGYEMTELTRERQRLLDERKKLQIEATIHSRTERLDKIARDSLGLEPIHAGQIIKVSGRRHAGRSR